MPTEPPIACTLTEAERPARRAQMTAIARDLVSADVHEAHAVLRFRPAAATRERVAAFVAAESRCCAFLRMELREDPDALTLTIDGPPGSEPVVAELVAAFARQVSATRGLAARAARVRMPLRFSPGFRQPPWPSEPKAQKCRTRSQLRTFHGPLSLTRAVS